MSGSYDERRAQHSAFGGTGRGRDEQHSGTSQSGDFSRLAPQAQLQPSGDNFNHGMPRPVSSAKDGEKPTVKFQQSAILDNDASMTSLLLFHPYEEALVVADEKDGIRYNTTNIRLGLPNCLPTYLPTYQRVELQGGRQALLLLQPQRERHAPHINGVGEPSHGRAAAVREQ
jgi:hypothetical protein